MFYGEHLHTEDIMVQCPCGIAATVEVIDKSGRSHGWFCRKHALRVQSELRQQEKLAKAIIRKKKIP
jgi:hypothetical protein